MQKNSNVAIFAIRPEYAKSILDGTKKYEYRKVACKKPIEKMLIYATAPIMQVVGEADIREVLVIRKKSGIEQMSFQELLRIFLIHIIRIEIKLWHTK